MDGWADSPDELERATLRTLLVFSSAMLGALALPGLLSGEPTGPLLAAGALLIAGGAAPIHDATLRRRLQLVAGAAAMLTWLLALPLFDREGMLVPASMAIGCGLLLRGVLSGEGRDDTPPPAPARGERAARTPSADGWIEEDGRPIPW